MSNIEERIMPATAPCWVVYAWKAKEGIRIRFTPVFGWLLRDSDIEPIVRANRYHADKNFIGLSESTDEGDWYKRARAHIENRKKEISEYE